MLIEKKDLLQIFDGLHFPIVEIDGLGKVIELSAYDAYDFSSITGANYLIYPIGITMKGRNETFIHRSVFQENAYIYSPGLFGRDVSLVLKEENSADKLLELFPKVFSGKKYVLILSIAKGESSNIDTTIHKKISELGYVPSDFILFKLFESGQSQESLHEYFASLHFINKGFIVENQTPWFQQNFLYKGDRLNGGIPDFSAFTTPIYRDLMSKGIVTRNRGILINKIPVLKNFIEFKDVITDCSPNYQLFIGEVKSDRASLDQAIAQMRKYAKVELANKVYSIIPNCSDNGVDEFGELFFENWELKIKESKKNLLPNPENQIIDNDWINTNIKMNLLGNVNFQELINTLVGRYAIRKDEVRSYHLVDYALSSTFQEIFETI